MLWCIYTRMHADRYSSTVSQRKCRCWVEFHIMDYYLRSNLNIIIVSLLEQSYWSETVLPPTKTKKERFNVAQAVKQCTAETIPKMLISVEILVKKLVHKAQSPTHGNEWLHAMITYTLILLTALRAFFKQPHQSSFTLCKPRSWNYL